MQLFNHARDSARFAALAVTIAAGCAYGYRGSVPFEGQTSLADIDTLLLELPPTELSVLGSPGATNVQWEGSFGALGATRSDAIANAEKNAMEWEVWAGILRLSAVMPQDVDDFSMLERLEVDTLSSLPHEIRGSGSVFVSGLDGYLRVELTEGEVELELENPGDISITTAGKVFVAVGNTADLHIDIADAGVIIVQLQDEDLAHAGEGDYQRTLGLGNRPLRIRAGGGRVELRDISTAGE